MDGPLGFNVVTHKYVFIDHKLEVGPFPTNFGFLYVMGPFMRADNEIGCPREVLNLF